MKYYIASSLDNMDEVRRLRDELNQLGHVQTYDWTVHGSAPNRVSELAVTEMKGVTDAEIVFVLLPGGRGTHTEMGIALAAGKPIVLISDSKARISRTRETCAFYWHQNVLHVIKSDFCHFMIEAVPWLSDFESLGQFEVHFNRRDGWFVGWSGYVARVQFTLPTRHVSDNDLIVQLDEWRLCNE